MDKNGKVLVNWAKPQEIGPNGWFLNYRFHQPELKGILRKGLSRFPSVKTLLHHEVCSLIEYEDDVDVEYKDLKTGKLDNIRAGFVIGCDGPNSFTRNRIGRGFEDLGFHEPWLVVDFILKNTCQIWVPRACITATPIDPQHTYSLPGNAGAGNFV